MSDKHAKYNLDDEAHDVSGSPVFNDGQAGIATNVELKEVNKPDKSDGKNRPDYEFIFADAQAREIKFPLYYVDPNGQYYNAGTDEQKRMSLLKHIANAFLGQKTGITGNHPNEILDSLVVELTKKNNAAFAGVKLNLAVNYGSQKGKAKQYLQVRNYAPFLETVEGRGEKPDYKRLKFNPDYERSERLAPDDSSDNNYSESAAAPQPAAPPV